MKQGQISQKPTNHKGNTDMPIQQSHTPQGTHNHKLFPRKTTTFPTEGELQGAWYLYSLGFLAGNNKL